jgi:DNA mismatch endonuclease (patch repair protein)
MGRWPGKADKQPTSFGDLSRSQLMKRVRSSGNETTEMALVRLLRKAGLKGWRRHSPLPGKPDFVWTREKVAVFGDGCFWHGHDCGRNLTPKTNPDKWREKIQGNKSRDRRVSRLLRSRGWSVVRVWECRLRKSPERILRRISKALDRAAA